MRQTMKSKRYFLTIGCLALPSTIVLFICNQLLIKDVVFRNNLPTCFLIAFGMVFITYDLYLLLFYNILSSKRYGVFAKGLFCLLCQTILYIIPTSLFGFDLYNFIMYLGAVGVFCFFIPFVDNSFRRAVLKIE